MTQCASKSLIPKGILHRAVSNEAKSLKTLAGLSAILARIASKGISHVTSSRAGRRSQHVIRCSLGRFGHRLSLHLNHFQLSELLGCIHPVFTTCVLVLDYPYQVSFEALRRVYGHGAARLATISRIRASLVSVDWTVRAHYRIDRLEDSRALLAL